MAKHAQLCYNFSAPLTFPLGVGAVLVDARDLLLGDVVRERVRILVAHALQEVIGEVVVADVAGVVEQAAGPLLLWTNQYGKWVVEVSECARADTGCEDTTSE